MQPRCSQFWVSAPDFACQWLSRLPVAATDPGDDMIIETAVNGGADVMARFNIDGMRAGAARFGIAEERPAAVLRRLRA